MYQIDNITIGEYFSLKDSMAYDIFIDTMKADNHFLGKSCKVSALTFNEVEVMKGIFRAPTFNDIKDLFILVFNIKGNIKESAELQFLNASVFDLFRAKNFLLEFISGIIRKEQTWLSGDETDEKLLRLNASERLKPFSNILTKIRIAEQFKCTPKEVGHWKYIDVFNIMVANKVKDDLQREYSQIK